MNVSVLYKLERLRKDNMLSCYSGHLWWVALGGHGGIYMLLNKYIINMLHIIYNVCNLRKLISNNTIL